MRTRCWHILVAVVPLGVLTGLPAARATLMRFMDLPELVGASDRIVVADVRTVQSAWDGSHRSIHTTVEVSVRESWKGTSASDEAITIRQLGGTVGEIEMTVHGMPSFSVGERALLFLHGTQVVGMEQGKRRLRWESATRRWLVGPAARTTAVLRAPRGKLRGTDPDAAEDLDSLRAKIRSLVGN
jgi:hypothetical protein